MSATQAVRELIEHQLEAIEIEAANLRDALRQLDRNGTPAQTRGNKRRRDTPLNLHQLLAENDGLTTSAIAERAGLGRDQALTLLKELEARSEVRRSGQRRGVRWHAITDEDRIRERAAELERLRRRT
jgi:hypothetical protein